MRTKLFALAALAASVLLGAPGAAASDPPTMVAQEAQQLFVVLPPGVDTVDGSASVLGERSWYGVMYGESASLTNLRIQLDRADPGWTFDPPVVFPISMLVPTLDPWNSFTLQDISGPPHSTVRTSFVPGVSLQRAVSVTTRADGSATAHVILTIRLVDPNRRAGAYAYVNVFVLPGVDGAQIDPDSVVAPDGAWLDKSAQSVQWGMTPNADEFVMSMDVKLPSGSGDVTGYRPYIQVLSSGGSEWRYATGTSVDVADSELGGTWTFSADQPTYWATLSNRNVFFTLPAVVPTPPPPPPAVNASVSYAGTALVPGADESVNATTAYPGSWTWSPQINNYGGTELASPSITLDGVGPQWTQPLRALPPFPIGESAPTLFTGANFPYDSRYNGIPQPLGPGFGYRGDVTPGYDVARTLVSPSTGVVPPGGMTQRWAVTVTLRDPSYAYRQVLIQVDPTAVGGTTTVSSLSTSPLGDGEFQAGLGVHDGVAFWTVIHAVTGKPYTLTLDVAVPNAGILPFAYRPAVRAMSTTPPAYFPGETSTSTTIHDDVLGGTFTFTLGSPVQWYRNNGGTINVSWSQQTAAVGERVLLEDVEHAADALGVSAAADDLAQALDPTLWVDDRHLTSQNGAHVFQLSKAAALALAVSSATGVRLPESLVDELYIADLRLATRAVNEAGQALGQTQSPWLDAARKQLELGGADRQPDAFDHYKNAWNDAVQALK